MHSWLGSLLFFWGRSRGTWDLQLVVVFVSISIFSVSPCICFAFVFICLTLWLPPLTLLFGLTFPSVFWLDFIHFFCSALFGQVVFGSVEVLILLKRLRKCFTMRIHRPRLECPAVKWLSQNWSLSAPLFTPLLPLALPLALPLFVPAGSFKIKTNYNILNMHCKSVGACQLLKGGGLGKGRQAWQSYSPVHSCVGWGQGVAAAIQAYQIAISNLLLKLIIDLIFPWHVEENLILNTKRKGH